MVLDKIKNLFNKKNVKPVDNVYRRPVLKKPAKRNRELPSLVYKKGNRFVVQKKISGVNYYFGSFATVDEAIERKHRLESVDWDKTKL